MPLFPSLLSYHHLLQKVSYNSRHLASRILPPFWCQVDPAQAARRASCDSRVEWLASSPLNLFLIAGALAFHAQPDCEEVAWDKLPAGQKPSNTETQDRLASLGWPVPYLPQYGPQVDRRGCPGMRATCAYLRSVQMVFLM